MQNVQHVMAGVLLNVGIVAATGILNVPVAETRRFVKNVMGSVKLIVKLATAKGGFCIVHVMDAERSTIKFLTMHALRTVYDSVRFYVECY